jgi:hypothetical protein
MFVLLLYTREAGALSSVFGGSTRFQNPFIPGASRVLVGMTQGKIEGSQVEFSCSSDQHGQYDVTVTGNPQNITGMPIAIRDLDSGAITKGGFFTPQANGTYLARLSFQPRDRHQSGPIEFLFGADAQPDLPQPTSSDS